MVVQGGGEMGSAAARLLFLAGFDVLILERAAPLAVRRRVAYAEAVFAGRTVVEGVAGERMDAVPDASGPRSAIPVLVDGTGNLVERIAPRVLVDARMAKRNLGSHRGLASLVIGLGPGFTAGEDVHVVIETQRGLRLGAVLWSGGAEQDSAVPSPVLGVTAARVVRAPATGAFHAKAEIGDLVSEGAAIGDVAGVPVRALVGGLLRGLLANGVPVTEGTKIGDIDPRGSVVDAEQISDKARAISAGVLEAVLLHLTP